MKKTTLPLILANAVIYPRKTIFQGINYGQVLTVEAPGPLMRAIVSMSDGRNSMEEVISKVSSEWDEISVRALIGELCSFKVILQGPNIADEAWRMVEEPLGSPVNFGDVERERLVMKAQGRQRRGKRSITAFRKTSPFGRLLERRVSTREFSGNIPFSHIINLLWSAYGETSDRHRVVPSAGALFPLTLHVAIFRRVSHLMPGIYRVRLCSPGSVGLQLVSSDIDSFRRSFLDPMMLYGAHGTIVISGSFYYSAEKYGSRSMLFVPLEAGHAAQNVHIAAVERNVATVEIGGFKAQILRKAINLPQKYRPLTTIVFGRKAPEIQVKTIDRNIEVRWDIPANERYSPAFAIASARMTGKKSWAHGRDSDPRLARIKAMAEAREWASCGCVPDSLKVGSLIDLPRAIDPRSIISFHPSQYRIPGFPFKPFDQKAKYRWAEAWDEVAQEKVHILADLVYFPYFPKTPYYAFANSSGVAAYPDKQTALKTAVLELVERDAFMCAYFGKIQMPTVNEISLPGAIKRRLGDLKKSGFKVWVKSHTLDLAPVICVFAQSEEHVCTTCASCSSFDVEYAVDHALMEVEASVLARIHNGRAGPMEPWQVVMPLDHGKLYCQKKYLHRADFLVNSGPTIKLSDVGSNVARSWHALLKSFGIKGWDLFSVQLQLSEKLGGSDGLYIVRAVVPGMVPMTFGNRQEPAGMARIYDIARRFGNHRLSYGKMVKFPHPFE